MDDKKLPGGHAGACIRSDMYLQPSIVYRGHTSMIEQAAWSPVSRMVASCGLDDGIHVWDTLSGKTNVVYTKHNDLVRDIAFSPDGLRIASCSDDGAIHVWNVQTGAQQYIYRGHRLPVLCVSWAPSGQFVASIDETTIHLWPVPGIPSGPMQRRALVLGKKEEFIFTAAFWTHDARRLVSASEGSIQHWDVVTGELLNLWDYRGKLDTLVAIAESPDGSRLALADDDAMVHVVCARTGSVLLSHNVSLDSSWGLSWSPSGKLLASCGYDAVQVWDACSGETYCTYHGHDGNVSAALWSSNGPKIASAGVDCTVQVWAPVKSPRTLGIGY